MGERDTLTQYMNEMRAFDVLDAKQEVAMAERIEALEIAHWHTLLAHADSLDALTLAVKPHIGAPAELKALKRAKPGQSAREKARQEEAVDRAAVRLRALDGTRAALADADGAVRATLGETRADKSYARALAKARSAQQAAKNAFMTANLRLVVSMARRYRQELMPLADLIQEGNLGLMRAVERFDHRKGFRFSTYAAWWIRHGLNRALSDKARLVRIPVHLLDDAAQVARVRAELVRLGNDAPTHKELAEHTGLSEEKVAFIETHAHVPQPTSLDRSVGEDQDATLLDLMPTPQESEPEDDIDAERWTERLGQLLGVLTPIEAAVLRFRFGLDGGDELTLHEVGAKYNLSRERIRQLQEQALGKLRVELKRRDEAHGDGLAA